MCNVKLVKFFFFFLSWGGAGSSLECGGQISGEGAQEARGGSWGVEEGFWNPGGRRRGGRGELQGPCNHCFAEGTFAEEVCRLVVRLFSPKIFFPIMHHALHWYWSWLGHRIE